MEVEVAGVGIADEVPRAVVGKLGGVLLECHLYVFVTEELLLVGVRRGVNIEFVEVRIMELDSPEHDLFNDIKRNYEFMGAGEAAVIALTQENGGVIASNNLKDVKDYVDDYDLNLITTAFILAIAYEKHIKTKEELDKIWTDMINNGRKRSLPRNISSFTQYYDELYPNECYLWG